MIKSEKVTFRKNMKEKMFRNYYQAWWHTFYLINLHGVDTVHCYGYVVIYEKGKHYQPA